jgi:pyruvate/2-oxoglutarate dehydrogenase complex dihydrolipoamide acyltransferase (E2) component
LPEEAWVLRAPRLNANDDSVTLTRWLVADGASVAAGAPVAEIETEKATAELAAEFGGTFVHAVAAGAAVPVGAPLAFIGSTPATAEAAKRTHAEARVTATGRPAAATAKAQALAAAHGIDLATVRATGATIKERDVARHRAQNDHAGGAHAHDPRLVLTGEILPHQRRVARDLRAAVQAGVFTTLSYRLDLRGPERMIAAELARGRTASLLVTLLWGLGRVLPAFPNLISVHDGRKIYRYRDIDIAFALRSASSELYAPVVRGADRLSADEIARDCARLAKRGMRGKLDARDVGGACFTVSVIATPKVESFVALPPPGQTAILALGAVRHEAVSAGAAPIPVATATVTYDHVLCDGIYVAEFCAALDRTLSPEPA